MPEMVLDYVLLFFFCSFLGWCMEVICKLIQLRRFINRGFLLGPWCPIYGFGAVTITLLLTKFADDPLAVFGLAILLCGTLEYLTSYLMETLFHARWWDYSTRRFNLNGRVCANTLVPFGLLGLVLIYFVRPFAFHYLSLLSAQALRWITGILSALFAADVGISTVTLIRLRLHADTVAGDSTETITAAVHTQIAERSALIRRTLRAFPEATIYNTRIATDLRERRRKIQADLKATRAQARQKFEEREKELRMKIGH